MSAPSPTPRGCQEMQSFHDEIDDPLDPDVVKIISVTGELLSANAGRVPGAGEYAVLDAAMERSAVEARAPRR
jgi:hypothetical protein